jgi:hypothetical protein
MAPQFSQQFCSVAPYTAGGALVAGRKRQSCLVQVTDGELVIIEAPSSLVDRAPVSTVELDTPALQQKVGAATFVLMNGHQWAIDFGRVGMTEYAKSGGVMRKVGVAFGAGTVRGMRRAREVNKQFVATMLSEGATNRRSPGTPPDSPA